MRDNQRGAEVAMQSMPHALGRRNCVLHMWTPYERWYYRKQEVHLIRAGPATRSQIRESTRMQRVPHGKSASKEVSQKRNMTTSTTDSSATSYSEKR